MNLPFVRSLRCLRPALVLVALLRGAGLLPNDVCNAPPLHADDDGTNPSRLSSEETLSLLQSFCTDCHGPDTQEAGLRFDSLSVPFQSQSEHLIWERVLEALSAGKMPPEGAVAPSDERRAGAVGRLKIDKHRAIGTLRASRSGYRTRRLTADEYNHTMQSLFDVETNFAGGLPPDPISTDGFQNDAVLLDISTLQLEHSIEIARSAVSRYVLFDPPSTEPLRYHIELEDLFYTVTERNRTLTEGPQPLGQSDIALRRAENTSSPPIYAPPLSPLPPGEFPSEERLRRSQPKLNQQFIPVGKLIPVAEVIVRIRAAGTPGTDGSVPCMRVEAGMAYGDGDAMDAQRLGEVDVTGSADQPVVYEFRERMENIPHPRDPEAAKTIFEALQLFISNVSRHDAAVYELGYGSYDDPNSPTVQGNEKRLERARQNRKTVQQHLDEMTEAGVNLLHLDSVEIEIIPSFGSGDSPKWLLTQTDESRQAVSRDSIRRFLRRFMTQAYRRPVSAHEIDDKLALFDDLRSDNTLEDSLRETLVAVLTSPHFLMLEVPPTDAVPAEKPSTPYQLATRLSYLLWSAPPDGRLRELAENGAIEEPAVFGEQAERLLDNPRSDRFLNSFCSQWLRLDRFPLIAVSPDIHPQYDDDLAEATLEETRAWFREVFRSNADISQLIDSNDAVLNARLARHYGLPAITGQTFRRVSLPEGSPRGGLITQAAVLTMNSDGIDSHPIRRGLWVLERLLHDPPPPPPPNIPDLANDDPDLEGLSLRQRIEAHRQPSSCQGCHAKLDPWGIALESFDATGRWREVIDHGRHADRPQPVEAAVELPDGTRISDVRALKQHLIDHHLDRLAHSLVHHMLTYALSRPLDLADRAAAQVIYEQFRRSGYQLRELVLAIVTSDAFRS